MFSWNRNMWVSALSSMGFNCFAWRPLPIASHATSRQFIKTHLQRGSAPREQCQLEIHETMRGPSQTTKSYWGFRHHVYGQCDLVKPFYAQDEAAWFSFLKWWLVLTEIVFCVFGLDVWGFSLADNKWPIVKLSFLSAWHIILCSCLDQQEWPRLLA